VTLIAKGEPVSDLVSREIQNLHKAVQTWTRFNIHDPDGIAYFLKKEADLFRQLAEKARGE